MNDVNDLMVAMILKHLIESEELADFLSFARKEAKKDGMDTDGLMAFFDALEEEYLSDDDFDWIEIHSIVTETTGCEAIVFQGDKSIIIENEKMGELECLEYLDNDKAKIEITSLNEALSKIGVKLEFKEAMNLPFEFNGFSDFIRFEVHKI